MSIARIVTAIKVLAYGNPLSRLAIAMLRRPVGCLEARVGLQPRSMSRNHRSSLPTTIMSPKLAHPDLRPHLQTASVQLGAGAHEKAIIQNQRVPAKIVERRLMALVAPLRRTPLPFELLGEIFTFALAHILDGEVPRALINLCLVSRTWRNAALTTAKLWDRLEFHLPNPGAPTALNQVECWLGRSGRIPKTLTIFGSCPSGCSSRCQWATPEMAKFLTEGPLLDQLSLGMIGLACFQKLGESMMAYENGRPRPWDSIRSFNLKMGMRRTSVTVPVHAPEAIFRHLPLAKALHLNVSDLYLPRGSVPYIPENNLSRITMLRLDCVAWGEEWILTTLKSCRRLETLTLDLRAMDFDMEHYPPIDLANLRTLRLCRTGSDGLGTDILDFLATPSLVELDISLEPEECYDDNGVGCEYSDMHYFSSGVLSLLQRSKCDGLCHLRIQSGFISAQGLTTILTNLHSLTYLTLDDVKFPSSVFTSLSKTIPMPLPNLSVLRLLRLPYAFHYMDVHDFIKTRKSKNRRSSDESSFDRLTTLTMSIHVTPYELFDQSSSSRNFDWFQDIQGLDATVTFL